eukprot:s2188_g9.t1
MRLAWACVQEGTTRPCTGFMYRLPFELCLLPEIHKYIASKRMLPSPFSVLALFVAISEAALQLCTKWSSVPKAACGRRQLAAVNVPHLAACHQIHHPITGHGHWPL